MDSRKTEFNPATWIPQRESLPKKRPPSHMAQEHRLLVEIVVVGLIGRALLVRHRLGVAAKILLRVVVHLLDVFKVHTA